MTALAHLAAASLRFGAISALQDVHVRVERGERLALIGANGSGKSSLLRVLHGLLPPTAGLRGADPAVVDAMVFQRPHVLRASALHNVALACWLRGMRWSDARVRALHALQRVGLGALAQRRAPALSVGQQQRVALARAWAVRPQLLYLDEPTASLDPHAKREVEQLMADFAQDGMTLVFASHNLGQVKRLASRVIYLEHGRVLADLPVREFFDHERLRAVSPAADAFVRGEQGG